MHLQKKLTITELKRYMSIAYSVAKDGITKGSVPVGAIVVKDGEIIAKAHNHPQNPIKHAEIIALNSAIKICGPKLTECAMFVTLEPCIMCTAAALCAEIGMIYFGAYSENGGIDHGPRLLDRFSVTKFIGGLRETMCSALVKEFFAKKR